MKSRICGIGDMSCGCNSRHSFGGFCENDVLVPNLVECDSDTYQGDKTMDETWWNCFLVRWRVRRFLVILMRIVRLATIAYLSYSIPNEPKLQQVINVKPNAEVKGSSIRSRSSTRMAQISKVYSKPHLQTDSLNQFSFKAQNRVH